MAVRGSRDGDEGWSEGLRENGRSGIGLIMKAFHIGQHRKDIEQAWKSTKVMKLPGLK